MAVAFGQLHVVHNRTSVAYHMNSYTLASRSRNVVARGSSGVEFVVSTCSNSLSLVRMALFRVSRATDNETNARFKLLSETLMGLYWMLSGL